MSEAVDVSRESASAVISHELLRSICLECGADEVGFVELDRKALEGEKDDILRLYSRTKSIVSLFKSTNRENIQSPAMNIADEEFKRSCEDVTIIARAIVKKLNEHGVRGVYSTYAFPADMTRWPAKPWDMAHKLIAVEAGLGSMGVNRLVLNPEYGAFITLNTLLIDTQVDKYDQPLSDNPCINCNLCVSVCPTGAVKKDGFGFMDCMTHSYRDTLAGFIDWVETIAESRNAKQYRKSFKDSETVSMWQSLTFGHSYKCSYCMSVCPAGKQPSAIYEEDKKAFANDIFKPLKEKIEPVYVIKGTHAEQRVMKNPAKEPRLVNTIIRPSNVASFIMGVELAFNPLAAEGVKMRAQFEFYGKESKRVTFDIAEGKVEIIEGHEGKADLSVKADSETWVAFLNEQVALPKALFSGKIKVSNPLLMKKFKECLVI